jgi:hypothetical protein
LSTNIYIGKNKTKNKRRPSSEPNRLTQQRYAAATFRLRAPKARRAPPWHAACAGLPICLATTSQQHLDNVTINLRFDEPGEPSAERTEELSSLGFWRLGVLFGDVGRAGCVDEAAAAVAARDTAETKAGAGGNTAFECTSVACSSVKRWPARRTPQVLHWRGLAAKIFLDQTYQFFDVTIPVIERAKVAATALAALPSFGNVHHGGGLDSLLLRLLCLLLTCWRGRQFRLPKKI